MVKAQERDTLDLFAHGGNIAEVRDRYALDANAILDFSANINPLGMPDSVRNTILSGLPTVLHYPDPECRRLRRKLAEHLKVKEASVLVGNGSTELMFLAARALLRSTACVIDPTFTEYRRAVEYAGRHCVSIVASDSCDFHISGDLVARAARNGKMVFACNPNNPTGAIIKGSEILATATRFADVFFVVDEAFCDFLANEAEASIVKLASNTRNIIVLRSLTKFYAIPGLRLGYAVAHEKNVRQMLRFKEPWSVNSLAEAAGCAALEDMEFARRTRESVAVWKDELADAIGRISGLQPLRPSVNFVLTKIVQEGVNVRTLQEELLPKGILIRNCGNFPGLDERYFRVAVRTPEENERLVEALRAAMEGRA
jgi:threonine-phosphate decarboxylase